MPPLLPPSNDALDARLRDVAVPAGLVARLGRIPENDEIAARDLHAATNGGWSDAALDRRLRAVQLPHGMVDRLTNLAVDVPADAVTIDTALRDVPLPRGLLNRLANVAKLPARRVSITRYAAAAMLLVAVGLAYAGAVGSLLFALRVDADPVSTVWVQTPLEFTSLADATSGLPVEVDVGLVPDLPSPEQVGLAKAELPLIDDPPEALQYSRPLDDLTDRRFIDTLLVDANLARWGAVHSAHTDERIDDLPEFRVVVERQTRGIDPPDGVGFNKEFFLRHHVFPFVPAEAFKQSPAPLWTGTSSYELSRRAVNEGHRPEPRSVRTEDFIAAIDYGYQPPGDGSLSLSTSAGPSPFRPGFHLIGLGVQAAPLEAVAARGLRPLEVTFAVDVSASMGRTRRLAWVRDALPRFVAQLGDADRVSLLVFDSTGRVLVERGDRGEADKFADIVASLQAAGPTNLWAGLQQAYAVAGDGYADPSVDRHVVLLTDGLGTLGRDSAGQIETALKSAAANGVKLHVYELGRYGEPDAYLAAFAAAGDGPLERVASSRELFWSLLGLLTSTPPTAATDATLSLTFNHDVVHQYRLIGHEGPLIIVRKPAGPSLDLRWGEAATSLFEFQFLPQVEGMPNPLVATAELSWRDAATGRSRTLRRTIGSRQFASHFSTSEPALQLAALAAETAEVLRRSPFVAPKRTLYDVLQAVPHTSAQLQDNRSFVELVEFLGEARKAKPPRRR